MKVFADLHHMDLFHSFYMLFEQRLGWELYRPIGLDWYHEKYWAIYPHINTANQYLSMNQAIKPPKDIHGNVCGPSEIINHEWTEQDGYYLVQDTSKGTSHRAVTLDRFKQDKFDIVIASIPQHIAPFQKLIQQHQPQAKFVFQIGNSWGPPPGVKNLMISCAPYSVPSSLNTVFYHQEFDLKDFRYTPPTNHSQINSYIHYMHDMDLHKNYRLALPDFQFKTYGAGMEACFHVTKLMADTIVNSAFTWHCKRQDDGYGHVVHNTFACGRPIIGKLGYYKNMGFRNGKFLMDDEVTAIDLDSRTVHANSKIIRELAKPENHAKFCERAYRRFCDVVNFDAEEQKLRDFFAKLL
jgi:hypothetical protein